MSSAKKLIIAVALCVFALMPLAVAQQAKGVFTENQANYVGCAKEKLYAVYTFLDPTKRFDDKAFKPAVCGKGREVAPITPPKWLEGTLPAMQSHMVWELPGSAAGRPEYLSEAEMWRRAIWRVWDFLTLAENINTGTTYTQQETMELFGNIRTNYLLELDRLNTNPVVIKYNMRDSMDGRGRTIMATLELINSEMDSVAESFVASPSVWREKFRKSVIGISVLSQNIYKDFMSQTPPMMPETYKRARDNSLLIMLLTMIGMFSIFFSVYKI
ncbi:MAG: hypothetical protein LBR90_01515, partial [Elusimicrobiota bacterium]|nr:hypothetical protein [Elusimicrobiota bacterium]